MNATNTFQDGLLLDSHPLAVPNNVLTNCLNGTLITYNGNELILQNDVGNSKITYKYIDENNKEQEEEVKLTDGFIPVGMKSFNGIIYIFSYNPSDLNCEIGTFPSPNYTPEKEINDNGVAYKVHTIEYNYKPLRNLIRYRGDINSNYDESKYSIVNFRTKKLNFDLQHPLIIDCQISYDESVNLIFNDGKNIPRIVNTGFAPYGDNKVKIIKRDLLLETNVYEEENLEYNTSLVRVCNSIVDIKFNGETEDGNMAVGNYVFYFTVADSDGNESDFIGQSGLVVCHKGMLNDPQSIDGGIGAENSRKSVSFTLSKIPRQFSRLYVYYSRYSSTAEGVLTIEYKKLDRYFDLEGVSSTTGKRSVTIKLTGNDTTYDISLADINPLNTNPLSAKTQALTSNRLFLGNIRDNVTLYQTLKKFSIENVTVTPNPINSDHSYSTTLIDVDVDYKNYFVRGYFSSFIDTDKEYLRYGYYNIHNIYDKVGYWPEEYYRFGIVYILDDYTLTPVFDIKGQFLVELSDYTNDFGIIKFPREYFARDEELNLHPTNGNLKDIYNPLRAIKLMYPRFSIKKNVPTGVIGCIFVRQKRLKNIIGLALLIGTDLNRKISITIRPYAYDGDTTTTRERDYEVQGSHLPTLWAGHKRKWVMLSFIRTNNHPLWPTHTPDDLYFDHVGGHSRPKEIQLGYSWIVNLERGSESAYPGTTIRGSLLSIFEKFLTDLNNTESTQIYTNIYKNAALMPEFELKLLYYSGLFTGQKFIYERAVLFGAYEPELGHWEVSEDGGAKLENWGLKHIKVIDPGPTGMTLNNNGVLESRVASIISVLELTVVKTENYVFSSVAGNASDPSICVMPFTHRLEYSKAVNDQTKRFYELLGIPEGDVTSDKIGYFDTTPYVRGIFSPYLGIEDESASDVNRGDLFADYTLINIKLNKSASVLELIEIRRLDKSEFYPISDRIDFSRGSVNTYECFRGDCYIGNFTHRMLRNFIDPEFLILDEIASKYCWSLGKRIAEYDETDEMSDPYVFLTNDGDTESNLKDILVYKDDMKVHLNRSDINAVPLGLWITFKYYSSLNPCMRSSDASNVTEYTTFGQARKFYPLYHINLGKGTINKLADSYVYNEGYEQSVGQRFFNLYPEVPTIKENFGNRIIYSELNVDTLVVNNLRLFRSNSYRDYTRQYGSIVKITPWSENYLAIVFEHGLALVQVNEKGVVSEVAKQAVYIDTTKVLGDLNMISEQFGSQWPESVIVTPTGLYGVDASAKKIWRYYTLFESISDLKVGKFLRDNLDVSPISNLVDVLSFNIKTHYNAKKQDIMFTFYKNLEYGNMLAWNLCYNEVTKKMTTFYSWIPLYSDNINNTYYSIPFYPEMSNLKLLSTLYPEEYRYYSYNFTLNIWEHVKKFNNWCNWYGEQHPFEFEYVVNANPNFQKIFNNILMIANKAIPESFHFEIVGEGYDFSIDKKNMYYRLEATKSFYDWCMSRMLGIKQYRPILYDKDGVDDIYMNGKLLKNPKSAIFPLYVKKVDYSDKIYDIYRQLTSNSKDYLSLSGSEITYDDITNDYLIDTHVKAYPKDGYTWQTICGVDDDNVNDIATYYVKRGIDIRVDESGEYLLKKVKYELRLSNCHYNEDSWYILVPIINYFEKNEDWSNSDNKPPINLVTDPIPEELSNYNQLLLNDKYPIETENWTTKKLTPLRDKYIRVKIRYTGDDFVVISGIINTFKESYN